MVFKKFASFFYDKQGSIRFQMDDWYDWHKDPHSFHQAAVEYLTNEGRTVETISVVTQLTSNEIATLLVDEKQYRLSVDHTPPVGRLQSAVLTPLD